MAGPYSCDFGRSIEGPKVVNVVFAVTDAKGTRNSPMWILEGDGRWDRFADYTHKPATFYEKDGLCWKNVRWRGMTKGHECTPISLRGNLGQAHATY